MSDQLATSQRWTAGADRTVGAGAGPTRNAVLQAIRALGFATTAEQYTYVTAERGSRFSGLSLTRTRVPVALRVDLAAQGEGTTVAIRIEDKWSGAPRGRAAAAVYGDVFTEVLTSMDDALKRLDPAAAASFDLWWRVLPEDQAVAGQS